MLKCEKCGLEHSNGKFCTKCGEKLINEVLGQEYEKIVYKTNLKEIFILVGSFVLLAIVIVILSNLKINDYKELVELKNETITKNNKKIDEYETKIWLLESETEGYKDKADFLDENIVFVLDGYGNYYYTYDQVQQVTQGKEYGYWAYNKEAAISQGYKKWK